MYLFYNIAIYFYYYAVAITQLFSKKVRKMWKGDFAAIPYLKEHVKAEDRYIWFHAASLGEFEQGRPLMEQMRKLHPECKILLTFFSPSGYEVRKDYKGADLICYLPIDTPRNAYRFLNTIHPEMAFFIKYEFWYNYLFILHHRHIPVYSVSSIFRDGQIFFRWYGRDYSHVLRCFTHLFVQNEKSRQLLEGIGVTNVSIVGDTRFDRVLEIKQQAKVLPIVECFVGNHERPVMVLGSSWPGDEEVIFPCQCKLIIAPHNVSQERINQIIEKCESKKIVRYSQADDMTDEQIASADVLIIDGYGLLSSIYRYGDITMVGGGFDPTGVHNVLEAAVWERPVIYGPDYKEYREAIALRDSGGGLPVRNKKEYTELMNRLLTDENYRAQAAKKAGHYVTSQQGATNLILKLITK